MRRTQRTDSSLLALGFMVTAAYGSACAAGPEDSGGAAGAGVAGMAFPTAGTTAGMGFPTGGMMAAGTTGGSAGTIAVPMAGTTGGTMVLPMAGTTGGMMAGTTGGMMAGTTGGMMAGTGGDPDGGAAGSGGIGGDPQNSCLEGITDFESDGPFAHDTETSGSVKLWVPTLPAGCKAPVVHLANGTGGTCNTYAAAMTRLASHGFLAVCFENGNTGAGTQGITAIETAYADHPDLADTKIGSTGHSQGGQAAFIVLQFAEAKWGDSYTYAGLAIQPASGFGSQPAGGTWESIYGMITSPMAMFSGTRDNLVSEAWVGRGFDALADTTEAYFYSAIGATHVPVPNAATQQIAIPWFRWKLLGDQAACEFFKAMPDGDGWDAMMSQAEAPCM